MTQATQIFVEAFLDNDSETFSYVVYETETHSAAIVDTVLDFDYKSGRTRTDSAQKIVDFVKQKGLNVEWILETHAHADHISAAPFVQSHVGGKIGIGEHIKDVQGIFKEVFNLEKEFLPDGGQFDHLFKDGETFSIGKMNIEVMHTPGHTPACLAYVFNGEKVFVGDTIFAPDVGTARCDFPGGSSTTLFRSIKRLLSLPEQTEIYLCHDYPTEGRDHQYMTTVGDERRHNIHVHDGVSEAEFVEMRDTRDATLEMPRLILPSIQVNIRAGKMPPADDNGKVYLKLPIDQL